MKLKKPSELFEQRRLEFLQKEGIKEEEPIKNKRIISPKELFGEIQEPLIIEEIIEEPIDPYISEINTLRLNLEEISSKIPEETNLTEVYQNIEGLRTRIDNLPKQKSYNNDINFLKTALINVEDKIPVVKEFDSSDIYKNISMLKNNLEQVRCEIPTIPEPILYDNQLNELKELVESVRSSIPVIPEIKYYEPELNLIIDAIEQVHSEIPEIPEIKYYDNQISKIENHLVRIENSIPEIPEIKYYDKELQDLNKKISNVKNSIRYYDEEIKDICEKLNAVKFLIPEIPEIKYYDKEIDKLNDNIKEIYHKVSEIKIPNQEKYLKEVNKIHSEFEDKNYKLIRKIKNLEEVFSKFNDKTLLNESVLPKSPEIKTKDPLIPLDQNFVTLDQLQSHYRLFINRIQQQLSTLGGGGAVRLDDLDDVNVSGVTENSIIKYNTATHKWIIGSLSTSSVAYSSEVIVSNGSTSETLSNANRTEEDVLIFVNGIFFTPTDDYTILNTSLNFSDAPIIGAKIVVKYLS